VRCCASRGALCGRSSPLRLGRGAAAEWRPARSTPTPSTAVQHRTSASRTAEYKLYSACASFFLSSLKLGGNWRRLQAGAIGQTAPQCRVSPASVPVHSCAACSAAAPPRHALSWHALRSRASVRCLAAMLAPGMHAAVRARHAAPSGAATRGAAVAAPPPALRGAAPLSAAPRAPQLRLAPALPCALSARAVRSTRRRTLLPPKALFEVLEKGVANAFRALNDTDDLSTARPITCTARAASR